MSNAAHGCLNRFKMRMDTVVSSVAYKSLVQPRETGIAVQEPEALPTRFTFKSIVSLATSEDSKFKATS
jgi:hypothetical protein